MEARCSVTAPIGRCVMSRFDVVEIPPQLVAVVRRKVPMNDLTGFFGEAFGWYHGMPTDTVDVAAGFAVSGLVPGPAGEVTVVERAGGRAAVGMHIGPYDTMVTTYEALQAWMAEQAFVPCDDMWEEYWSEPKGDPSTWQTRIVWPLA